LLGAKFTRTVAPGKYLLVSTSAKTGREPVTLLGHLGMTAGFTSRGKTGVPPRHAAVVLDLGGEI